MSLNLSLIGHNAAKVGFGIAASVAQPATLTVAVAVPVYNPVTDTTTLGTAFAVTGILYQSREQKLSLDAARTGMFAMEVAAVVKAGFTGTPTAADKITIGAVTWDITRVDVDPSGSIMILNIRH